MRGKFIIYFFMKFHFVVWFVVVFKRFFTGRCGRCGVNLRFVRRWNCVETFNGCSVGEIIELVRAGVNVNVRDKMGMTPILFASRFCGDPLIIKILIDNGADVSVVSNAGMSVVDYANLNACLSVRNYVLSAFNRDRSLKNRDAVWACE